MMSSSTVVLVNLRIRINNSYFSEPFLDSDERTGWTRDCLVLAVLQNGTQRTDTLQCSSLQPTSICLTCSFPIIERRSRLIRTVGCLAGRLIGHSGLQPYGLRATLPLRQRPRAAAVMQCEYVQPPPGCWIPQALSCARKRAFPQQRRTLTELRRGWCVGNRSHLRSIACRIVQAGAPPLSRTPLPLFSSPPTARQPPFPPATHTKGKDQHGVSRGVRHSGCAAGGERTPQKSASRAPRKSRSRRPRAGATGVPPSPRAPDRLTAFVATCSNPHGRKGPLTSCTSCGRHVRRVPTGRGARA